ncbi:hypothetical protein AGOR_G00076870 [Albula goreensis]|uniref:G-protein coupled receptors family 1 profile domain-containing protein n=1 Tax=Albula goreensis TaxID=1534307 RepID=A0A8T3DP64_9TELE|nr:hypothetical protein AGOR_G00076870 [Albula goreensis]
MVNLASTDFMYGLSLPFLVASYIMRDCWVFGDFMCRLVRFLFYFNLYCSIFFLTCISVHRYLGICHPMKTITMETKKVVKGTCVLVWAVVFALTCPIFRFAQTGDLTREADGAGGIGASNGVNTGAVEAFQNCWDDAIDKEFSDYVPYGIVLHLLEVPSDARARGNEMERMEVDQSAGAVSGGGALRRSNSAPMITGVSDSMMVFSSTSSARYRRSSMSVNPSCPGLALPLSPFSVGSDRSDHQRQDESMELNLRRTTIRERESSLIPLPPVSPWNDHISLGIHSLDSGVTPNSSPSPTRRYRNRATFSASVRLPALPPLKRKGGVESDAPPKKLFVAGVTDSPHLTGYTVSVSQAAGSPPGGVSVCATSQGSPLSLSPPTFTSQHHSSI